MGKNGKKRLYFYCTPRMENMALKKTNKLKTKEKMHFERQKNAIFEILKGFAARRRY